ncbi:PKD domain-containing protein [Candidatus Magnetomorum sp. HK-1]|nr:PKD domain-containing protein [Candidatus Magnetomorum sp. HK-1]
MQKKIAILFIILAVSILFGISYADTVSISGDYRIVGSPYVEKNGIVKIYKRNGNSWEDFQTITANDGAESDYFGYAVFISGYYAVIGAIGDDDKGSSSGSAYIFKLENSSWKQVQKLTPSDGAKGDVFGVSVSISNNFAIVGATGDDDIADSAGTAYIYTLNNNTWTQSTKIRGTEHNQQFGNSVLITENSIIIKDYKGLSYTYPFHITISGYIKNPKNTPQSDVTITFSNNGGTTSTDSAGYYSHELTIGYSGLATPNKPGYKFSPASALYNNLLDNYTNQHYTAQRFTLTGYIKDPNGKPMSNVEVVFSYYSGTAITDENGFYSHDVDYHWTGTITPQKTGLYFSPASRSFTDVLTNHSNNDFTAQERKYTISGTITDQDNKAVPSVKLCLNNENTCTQTNASGNYTFDVNYQFTGNISPEKEGYSFSPHVLSYSNVSSNLSGQNYAAMIHQYILSGIVQDNHSNPLSDIDIRLNGTTETIKTNISGQFQLEKRHAWKGRLIPEKDGYDFEPEFIDISSLKENMPDIVFTATKKKIVISGTIMDQNNLPVKDVTIKFTNSGIAYTDKDGIYQYTVDYGWSGKAEVFKMDHVFVPPSQAYDHVQETITAQDYLAYGSSLPAILVSPDQGEVTYESGSVSFQVYVTPASLSWSFNTSNSWINVEKRDSSVVISYQSNPQEIPRTGIISISATDAANSPQLITIYQEGKPKPTPGPGWDKLFNASSYQYHQTITAVLTDDNNTTYDHENDILAAFVGDELRGVARPIQTTCGKRYFLQIWSNMAGGEDISFMHYNAKKDKLNVNIQYPITFQYNTSLGTIMNPHKLIVSDYYMRTALNKYWNWLTINVISDDMSVNAILSSIADKGIIIVGQQGYAEYMPAYQMWQGSLSKVEPHAMYMLKTNDIAILEVSGNSIDLSTYPISLKNGWNWLGYLPAQSISINHALASINNNGLQICGQSGFADFLPDHGWFGSISKLEPNSGYKLKMKIEDTLYYPTQKAGRARSRSLRSHIAKSSINGWTFDSSAFQHQLTVTSVVKISDQEKNNPGDALVAFVDGQCRGIAKPIETPYGNRYFLQVWGSSGEIVTTQFYDATINQVFPMAYTLTFMPDQSIGTISEPYIITQKSISEPDWKIQASEYKYQATLTSLIKLDGETLIGADDRLAAFINDECRGIAESVETPYGRRFFLQVWSNEDQDIHFKLYHASNNDIYDTTKTLLFEPDKSYGSIEYPEQIDFNATGGDCSALLASKEALISELKADITSKQTQLDLLKDEIDLKDKSIIDLNLKLTQYTSYSQMLTPGMYLFGNLNAEVTPRTNPPGAIKVIYAYDNDEGSYKRVDKFMPLQGYWVFIEKACEFIVELDSNK